MAYSKKDIEEKIKRVASEFPKNTTKNGLCIIASKQDETDIKECDGFEVKYFNIVPKGNVYIVDDYLTDHVYT